METLFPLLVFVMGNDIVHPKYAIGSLSSQDSAIITDKEFVQGSKLCLEDFELIKVIGKGGFSKVF